MRAAVLAGGAGSRLGGQKPSALLAGRPLIEYPVAAMLEAGFEVSVVAKPDTELPSFADLAGRNHSVEVVIEPIEPLHPLLGIVTALRYCGEAIVVAACDMPFITPELVTWLAKRDESAVALPECHGALQPMFGRYSSEALTVFEDAVDTEQSVVGAVRNVGAQLITESEIAAFGDPAKLLFDVDDEADMRAAARMFDQAAS